MELLHTRCLIDGAWVDAEARIDVRDPSTGARIADIPALDAATVDTAIAAALRAFPAWRDRPAHERAAVLTGLAARMADRAKDLAALITAENGKPTAEAIGEVRYAASFLTWFAGEAVRLAGETIPATRADQRIVVTREPVGPCALITPWNFPAAMLTRKLGAALAAGCTVVAKPAEQTPFTALALGELAMDAGAPPGVVNIVTGKATVVGTRLTTHKAIRKISFTGSTEVGMKILETAAKDLKRVSLELGGNAPLIIFEDADLDRAIAGTITAKFRNAGQSCVAANRVLIARPLHDLVAQRLVTAASKLEVGQDFGPLIDDHALTKIVALLEDALGKGAKLLHGKVPKTPKMGAVVIAGITPEMAMWREEIFGPVLALSMFEDEADAIAKANDTDAGLVAYVFTRDAARADRVTRALEVGMVGVNEGLVSTAQAPFGGVKHSGHGREGGRQGIDDYVNLKYVMTTI